ncbi:hypothetical protein [Mesorhizobium sp.]|uniref:hypothetical protein n=1 Tax=Mesorhizobium sp. TaxID=1871066 RepID=UPI000FE683FF|nr:hypothetical protein [Mesorhizobium sp.]RWN25257.1 MAG: hypothetical protein EOR95_29100 [Mesorhizobium sp.]
MINAPKWHGPYPDRDIDCQQAIEWAFQELMENVIATGWSAEEVAEAIEHLAMADKRAREENAALDASLLIARVLADRTPATRRDTREN